MSKFTTTGAVPSVRGGSAINLMTTAATDWGKMSAAATHAHDDALTMLRNTNAQVHAKRPSAKVLRYAERYFLTDPKQIAAGDLMLIRLVITKIWNGLSGDVTLKIGSTAEVGALGKVKGTAGAAAVKPYHNQVTYADTGLLERAGAIQISSNRLDQGRLGVKTLVHEASHKYAGTQDYCYFDDDSVTPRSTFTDKNKALTNADSYAWFVVKVGRGFFTATYSNMFKDFG